MLHHRTHVTLTQYVTCALSVSGMCISLDITPAGTSKKLALLYTPVRSACFACVCHLHFACVCHPHFNSTKIWGVVQIGVASLHGSWHVHSGGKCFQTLIL